MIELRWRRIRIWKRKEEKHAITVGMKATAFLEFLDYANRSSRNLYTPYMSMMPSMCYNARACIYIRHSIYIPDIDSNLTPTLTCNPTPHATPRASVIDPKASAVHCSNTHTYISYTDLCTTPGIVKRWSRQPYKSLFPCTD